MVYSNESKMRELGVEKAAFDEGEAGAVSHEVAIQMAKGARYQSDSDVAISITGIAGPGGSNIKPEGMVCFSVAFKKKTKLTKTKQFGPLGRNIVKEKATIYGLNLLKSALNK